MTSRRSPSLSVSAQGGRPETRRQTTRTTASSTISEAERDVRGDQVPAQVERGVVVASAAPAATGALAAASAATVARVVDVEEVADRELRQQGEHGDPVQGAGDGAVRPSLVRHRGHRASVAATLTPVAVDAVIFDWGGTLTQWHDIDFHAESLALAQAVVQTADEPVDLAGLAPRLHQANAAIWGRSRDEQRSSTIGDLFTEAGLDHDPELLHAYYEFWVPHTTTDPEVASVVRGVAGERDQGRRAVQHDLAARLAPRLLRA